MENIIRQRSAEAREHRVRVEGGTVRPVPAQGGAKMAGTGMKLPNLAGVGTALAKLKTNLEARAAKFIGEVEATDQRGGAVFERATAHLAGAHAELKGVQEYLDEVEGAIGGNGGPLDESGKS